MNKTFKRVLSMVLAVIMVMSVCFTLVACGDKEQTSTYTYKSYTTALGNNWNPHTWETNADDSILGYLSSPFVTMEAKDTENGVYQWVYEMATSIKDVTADRKDDLTKYGVDLGSKTLDEITKGYVFEIKLNKDAKWQNGVKITSEDYIYSMQQLLNPEMKNYRANLYIAGESALAGAFNYYYSKDEGYYLGYTTEYNSISAAVSAGASLYINVWDFWGAKGYTDANGNACPQYVSINDTTVYGEAQDDAFTGKDIYDTYKSLLDVGGGYEDYLVMYVVNENVGASWDKVGLYADGDYTIYYVCDTAIDYNYFLTSCTSTWLVYKDLYEAGKDTTGTLVTTNYGTSMETSMSYGVYKMASFQEEKQIVFVQNDQWYGWETSLFGDLKKDDEGNLISYTTYHENTEGDKFVVDGEELRQHVITSVVIDVMDEATAKSAFLSGKLSDWAPNADELVTYAASDRLYKVDETYTMSFFFNTNVDDLKEMDKSKGNVNSVVLSNLNFRKAFSYAINRAEYVTATEGYKPAFSLMNNLYYYDFYNDPNSSYRNTEQAMEAICNLYGVKWGTGTPYATIKEAHDSITGYNLTEAKALMKTACDELVAAGLYTKGAEIKIKIGWAKGALTSADNQQLTLMNKFINAAIEGSGFGKVTFEAVGNIADRYGDVAKGEYAVGYGAWGGAALYPFRNFQVYCDPDQYAINEAACWNPKTEKLTLNINGENVTMTWQEWGNSMIGTGKYADADFETKLDITSMLETKFLEKYYRIPLAGTTICSMLSYQFNYYTENYNLAYGFGGSRLMSATYDDAEWEAVVAEQGGTVDYE